MAVVEKIFADLFRIELPLPNNPLKAVNCYLVAGQDQWLIVDTGMNRRACRDAMAKALGALDVALVLPGHRAPLRDHKERIRQLIAHHSIGPGNRLSAWQVAARMRWDYNGPWANFPAKQKWFATGEALAHLVFLLSNGAVKNEKCGQIGVFGR